MAQPGKRGRAFRRFPPRLFQAQRRARILWRGYWRRRHANAAATANAAIGGALDVPPQSLGDAPSPGEERALAQLFGPGARSDIGDAETLRVAETPTVYTATPTLEQLAATQRLSVNELGTRVDLTGDALLALSQGKVDPETIPLVALGRLARALDVSLETARAACAEPSAAAMTFAAFVRQAPSLSAERRRRWLALVADEAHEE